MPPPPPSTTNKLLTEWLGPVFFGLLAFFSIKEFSTTTTQHNSDVADNLSLTAALVLLGMLCSGRNLKIPASVLAWGAAFAASTLISIIGSDNLLAALSRAYLYTAALAFAFAAYLSHRQPSRSSFARYCIVIGAVHTYFLVQVIFWLLDTGGSEWMTSLAVPHFSNVRHFAYLAFMGAACGSCLVLLSKRLEATSFVLTASALFGCVLLGSRGALVAWVIFIIIVGIWTPSGRLRFYAISLSAAVAAVGAAYYNHVTGLLVAPGLFARFEMGWVEFAYSAGRIQIWGESLRALIDQPWFGYGPEGFLTSDCCTKPFVNPHNAPLQFLLEFGVLGCLLLAALLASAVRQYGGLREILKATSRTPAGVCLISLWLAFLAYSLVDGLLYHAIPLMHFGLISALLAAHVESSPEGAGDRLDADSKLADRHPAGR